VTHAGHDRQRRLEHRAGDGLLVECPQVLDRSAAARDDQDVGLRPRVGRADGVRDRRRGAGAPRPSGR
jgi:hypothetical protein